MDLPVNPPVEPMLARSVKDIPIADGLHYEPKWDGFRCIVFRDGDEVELGSRNERPLTRYFPEVVDAVRANLPVRCVVDGEIVIAADDRLHFEALLERIHPADSRVRMLAERTPASFVAFDLLAIGDESLMDTAYEDRMSALDDALGSSSAPVYRTRRTTDPDVARDWFGQFEGAGLDGLVVKAADLQYRPGQRAMSKVKHERTADCVVAGFRWHKSGPVVGSLLLGIYDDSGVLQHVGVVAAFSAVRRKSLLDELAPYRADAAAGHPWLGDGGDGDRRPGAVSRWNAGKDLSFEPLRPELVVEVRYDHMEGTRFRHTAQFARWRPDRTPESCTYDQLAEPISYRLSDVLA
jgi:ATP-dependent DNA ligase